jgi:DNA repair protein RadC
MTNQSHSQLSEIKVSYTPHPNIQRIKIKSSHDALDFLYDIFPVDINHREAMVAIYLNRANTVVGYATISIGGVSQTLCDPKIVFQKALLTHASALILVHNHPSGNLQPSEMDTHLTQRIREGGELLDIRLLDHLIITKDSYYSFSDGDKL